MHLRQLFASKVKRDGMMAPPLLRSGTGETGKKSPQITSYFDAKDKPCTFYMHQRMQLPEYLQKGWRYIPDLIKFPIQSVYDKDLQACRTRHRQSWGLLEESSVRVMRQSKCSY